MYIKNIEKIIILTKKYNLNRIKIKKKDLIIEINNNCSTVKNNYIEADNTNKSLTKIIKSPLTGIFYSSLDPGKKPFIKEGDKVQKGDILCIIEVMKTLHQIKSDCSGIIIKIFITNETLIKCNDNLFLINYV